MSLIIVEKTIANNVLRVYAVPFAAQKMTHFLFAANGMERTQ